MSFLFSSEGNDNDNAEFSLFVDICVISWSSAINTLSRCKLTKKNVDHVDVKQVICLNLNDFCDRCCPGNSL